MAKQITHLHKEMAHGKRLWAKAEYAVATALSASRMAKGLTEVKVEECHIEGADHIGSFFYTTDQMGEFYCTEENPISTNAVVNHFDLDNMQRDIDLWCSSFYFAGGRRRFCGKRFPVSVKMQTKALFTGNISLEMSTYNSDTRETRQGWFVAGQAQAYAFVIGTKVVVVDKKALQELVEQNQYRTVGRLTNAAFATNKGRHFNDASNILVPVTDVLAIAKTFELPCWFVAAFKASEGTDMMNRSNSFWTLRGL